MARSKFQTCFARPWYSVRRSRCLTLVQRFPVGQRPSGDNCEIVRPGVFGRHHLIRSGIVDPIKGDTLKNMLSGCILPGIFLMGAISAFAQAPMPKPAPTSVSKSASKSKPASTVAPMPLMRSDAYVSLFVGRNIAGTLESNSATVSVPPQGLFSGCNSSGSLTNLSELGGMAGGVEAGYFWHMIGMEADDILINGELPSQSARFNGNNVQFPQVSQTQDILLFNAQFRIPLRASWGMWYPYVGGGFGVNLGGTAQNHTPGYSSNAVLQPGMARDLKGGVATAWRNGIGMFVESQFLWFGENVSNTFSESEYGYTFHGTETLKGTSFNGVVDVGVSYNFKL